MKDFTVRFSDGKNYEVVLPDETFILQCEECGWVGDESQLELHPKFHAEKKR